jgi:hypothetical protein
MLDIQTSEVFEIIDLTVIMDKLEYKCAGI